MKSSKGMKIVAMLLSAASLTSCGAQRYAVDPSGRLTDSTYSYRNDVKELDFIFGSYRTQYGFVDVDRHARRILRKMEVDPARDTILFSGSQFFCIDRRSEPSYLRERKDHPLSLDDRRNYVSLPVLDMRDLHRSGLASEEAFRFTEDRVRNDLPRSVRELLRSTHMTRKTKVFPRRKTVLTEYRIPWRDRHISMIFVEREYNGKDELHSWKGGGAFRNPAAPDNLGFRGAGWQFDFDLRMTRENAMRLLCPGGSDRTETAEKADPTRPHAEKTEVPSL